mmetsp:Transcript_13637/g.27239  ORF Transcript_13637/g.27239 Transcript_13637/m.27239 type:complete len:107 (-) Transcript_13637:858-1178(-)
MDEFKRDGIEYHLSRRYSCCRCRRTRRCQSSSSLERLLLSVTQNMDCWTGASYLFFSIYKCNTRVKTEWIHKYEYGTTLERQRERNLTWHEIQNKAPETWEHVAHS